MKHALQAILFQIGFVLAGLIHWRDRTWMGDAKVFLYGFHMGASFKAPDGKTNYQFGFDWGATSDMAYAMAEVTTDKGRRMWAMRATDDELSEAMNRNQQTFSKVANISGYEEVVRWLDDEHRIILAEMKHRVRFQRERTSLGREKHVAEMYPAT